jgi:hypothetical protein
MITTYRRNTRRRDISNVSPGVDLHIRTGGTGNHKAGPPLPSIIIPARSSFYPPPVHGLFTRTLLNQPQGQGGKSTVCPWGLGEVDYDDFFEV